MAFLITLLSRQWRPCLGFILMSYLKVQDPHINKFFITTHSISVLTVFLWHKNVWIHSLWKHLVYLVETSLLLKETSIDVIKKWSCVSAATDLVSCVLFYFCHLKIYTLSHLPTQTHFPIGGERVMGHGAKLAYSLEKQKLELSTITWSGRAPWNRGRFEFGGIT